MEVHHGKIERKRFKEYVLEGLMIFIAVSLGFIAENIRDHYSEKKITRQYLETFRQELVNNKKTFQYADSMYGLIMPAQDSIIRIFFEKKENDNLFVLGHLLKKAKRTVNPVIDRAAYQQMVNAGGLKYLDNTRLKDSLSNYIGKIQSFENYNSISYNRLANALPELMKLEDVHDFGPRIQDPNIIPVMMPYPDLTERERRLIVYYYTNFMVQFSSDKKQVQLLNTSNDQLMRLVDEELK